MSHLNPQRFWSRRELLNRFGGGIAGLAASELLSAAPAASTALAPRAPHFAPKAKAVISIFCYGGVSHLDTFDPKPYLAKHAGETIPGKSIVPSQGTPGGLMPSLWEFSKHGECGMEVSTLFPHVAKHVDKLALIRSMHSKSNDHAPALYQMNTGFIQTGYPSVGSWVTYGLGTENQNLPAFVVFTDPRGGPIGGAPNWGNGFIPTAFQGTQFRSTGDPIVDLKPPKEMTPERQRRWLDFLQTLNHNHLAKNPQDNELSARIATYELAFRMQTEATEAVDLGKESEATRKLYGLDQPITEYVGRQALMARRLVERGVRYVQIFSGGGNFQESWDAHWDIQENHGTHCAETDKPIAGLLEDLKSRGMLDSTLVIWHGEFGRLPISQRLDGRDHNPYGFSIWLAGGGIKGGSIVGSTDEFGLAAEQGKKSINDVHATILHCLGLDHTRLTYPYNGRFMRLTDVEGELIQEILA
jgi:hypothetical protein